MSYGVMSHRYFGRRVVGSSSRSVFVLALATRKHTTINTTIALVHTVFCTKTAPKPAVAGGIAQQQGQQSVTAAAAGGGGASSNV